MRVLCDANILISYLISSNKESPIVTIIDAVLEQKIRLLLPHEVVDEFARIIRMKEYLAQRIFVDDANELITSLYEIAEILPKIDHIPSIGRDRKDDYVLAYAVSGQADIIITGDEDLLVLGHLDDMKVMSPAAFVKLLKSFL